jgi:maltooligosyltrehalose trehalohydrolase
MHTFSVWAPDARTVAVRIGPQAYPLERSNDGWWKRELGEAQAATEYMFDLDGNGPVPDPKSPFQPRGVNGPSQIIDHSAFEWTDAHWQQQPLSSAIIYELHIGTFTCQGTFLSAIERLDHLVDLGVTHVELMPVVEFSGDSGWGYDGVDLYAPHHAYGTPDDLKTFVNACHSRGLAVLLDVVYNHLGPSGNYLIRFGPYFTDAYNTPWGKAVNLDHAGSTEVRRFFFDNALMWLRDYHFDGLRLDAIHALYDRSAFHFLQELSTRVDSFSAHLGRHFVLIAESDLNDARVVIPREAGGLGMDAQWSDDFHHALHSVITGETDGYYEDFGSLADLAKAFKCAFVYDGCRSDYRKRTHGKPVGQLSGHHFLAYSQTHDQVGNRARGERLSHLASLGRSKIAAALVMVSPFVPMLFQGEEFGASSPFQYFTHHEDPDLARSVSEGRKHEFATFGWNPEDVPDPQDRETFKRSKVRWEEIGQEPHAELLDWYKQLIRVRRKYESLTDGCMDKVLVHFDEEARWFIVKRGEVTVVTNFASERQKIPCACRDLYVELCSDDRCRVESQAIELAADSVAILASFR